MVNTKTENIKLKEEINILSNKTKTLANKLSNKENLYQKKLMI